MEMNDALDGLTALAHETRLSVFRLLVEHQPDGLAAGQIADAVAAKANTLSPHLAVLVRSGLVTAEREGRSIRYRVDLAHMRGLIVYLMEDCCGGRPEVCAPVMELLSCRTTRSDAGTITEAAGHRGNDHER